jgi:hypothetical protein
MVPSFRGAGRAPLKFVAHSYAVTSIAVRTGWLPGARYSNLRDVRRFDRLGFLDIDWRAYNFERHLAAAKATMPLMTVARDVEDVADLERILDQAERLSEHADCVLIVPKDTRLQGTLEERIPAKFAFGYSVPTRYGGTKIPTTEFKRPVHLLGGRPDVQFNLAGQMDVFSVDCNRFTLDAGFGDYFDGGGFRPHPTGGYLRCIEDSIANIDRLWSGLDCAA